MKKSGFSSPQAERHRRRYSGSRIGVPGKQAAKWHFPQENATFRIPEKGT